MRGARNWGRGISVLSALGIALAGCYSGRDAYEPDGPAADDGADGMGDDGAAGDDDDGGSAGDDDGVPEEPSCGSDVELLAPMRRLTGLEYDNTVRDLLGDDSRPARGFTPDEEVAGFAANSVAPLAKTQLDEYLSAAEALAETAVSARWDAVVGCDAASEGCAAGFIADFGRRAFRRPLTAAQRADYEQLFSTESAAWGETAAIASVITAMLMSPHFLYHTEPTTGTPGELTLLDDFTLASRLSYFAWASMPDDELLDAATAGELTDPAALADHARRLLADPRADAAIASFHTQWLGTDALASATKDPELFPEWTPELVASMEQEGGRFAAQVVREGDATLHTLLTADWTLADAGLAELYGVAAPADGFAVVTLDPEERAGVLTQVGFLAANAHAAEVSWVHRGKFVREQMLCNELPPPPPGVEVNEANDPSRIDDPNCSGCHLMMDPIGKGFDQYSAIGTFRAVDESGATIDPSGEVFGVDEVGPFEGVVELAHALAESPQVHGCVTRQWLRYATRRKEHAGDECTVASLTEAFGESGQNVRELIVAIVGSDAFRFRTQP